MKSTNFEFLRPSWPELADAAALAESYAHTDPESALVKLRSFAENLTKDIYRDQALPKPFRASFIDLLTESAFETITPKVIRDKLHALRINGNKAAHGETITPVTALWLLKEAHALARWVAVNFDKADPASFAAFKQPSKPENVADIAAAKRKLKVQLEDKEKQLEALLTDLDEARKQAASAEKKAQELEALGEQAQQSADLLGMSEEETRLRIIDNMLANEGWDVGPGRTSTDEVSKEYKLKDQPTESGTGYADYVLWDDDGAPLAVIEAKKSAVDPERGRTQAKIYADALFNEKGVRPAIFYTNGYDIWLWDDEGGYPPRKLFGYYSKDSLQYLVKFQRKNKQDLATLSPQENIVNRLYQLEAIKRVGEKFTEKHRKALVVQATGTGKTRVAIALAELLIRAGWAKRVLFLCDRRELRKQAKNAFTDFLPSSPIKVVNTKLKGDAHERIFVATYPAMLRIFQSFDVGFFDLIIADESHRSIYNVYGDLFHYFDALQVGLTATPVNFVTRSTFNLFNCEGLLPTSNYDLEQAIEDDYLVPFEVYEHTTQFLREGIRLAGLTEEQIKELEEQGEDPESFEFEAKDIDSVIFNKDTNRAILRNLMENGIKDAAGQTVGKTIIFARSHDHAVLLGRLFDEMYPQYGGQFCQVIDNYDPRAEQLIDDFKGVGDNTKLTIAISVDMMDTGIDVPEVVNLVFAKPVKSPVKFWQMIGRGTRLCPDLFGPGEDKTVFRIFDHWGNFERFETGYQPAEPTQSKSTLQVLFEERLALCQTALDKSEIGAFDTMIKLVGDDIRDLDEKSISIREKWREIRNVLDGDRLERFEPVTQAILRQDIAPLMQWRTTKGAGEAHQFDLLIARLQSAVLKKSAGIDDLKIDFIERIGRLRMNISQVKDAAEVIKRVKSDEFWQKLTFTALEEVRIPLRNIIHLWDRGASVRPTAKTIDVREDKGKFQYGRRKTSYTAVEMKAYKQIVEAELKKHFETNPVLKKIRNGEAVQPDDLRALVSLVHTQNPNVTQEDLEAFFASTAMPMEYAIRSIVGLSGEAVKAKFSSFVLAHPSLTAKQTKFLGLLQTHIIQHGFIKLDTLYEAPFTVIDADGPEGVFENPTDIDDLMKVINLFVPPETHGDDQDRTIN